MGTHANSIANTRLVAEDFYLAADMAAKGTPGTGNLVCADGSKCILGHLATAIVARRRLNREVLKNATETDFNNPFAKAFGFVKKDTYMQSLRVDPEDLYSKNDEFRTSQEEEKAARAKALRKWQVKKLLSLGDKLFAAGKVAR